MTLKHLLPMLPLTVFIGIQNASAYEEAAASMASGGSSSSVKIVSDGQYPEVATSKNAAGPAPSQCQDLQRYPNQQTFYVDLSYVMGYPYMSTRTRESYQQYCDGMAAIIAQFYKTPAPFSNCGRCSFLASAPTTPEECSSHWWLTASHKWQWTANDSQWLASLTADANASYGNDTTVCNLGLKVDHLKVFAESIAEDSYYDSYPKLTIKQSVSNDSSLSAVASESVEGAELPNVGPCGGIVKSAATRNGITWQSTATSGCYGISGTH